MYRELQKCKADLETYEQQNQKRAFEMRQFLSEIDGLTEENRRLQDEVSRLSGQLSEA